MSFGNFFDRAAVAASQILHGYEEATFKHHLEHSVVGIAFDESAAGSVEAKTTLSLTVNLLSRLYPRLLLKPRGENASGLLDSLITIAKSINPLIDFVHESEEPTFCISVGTSSAKYRLPGHLHWFGRLVSAGFIQRAGWLWHHPKSFRRKRSRVLCCREHLQILVFESAKKGRFGFKGESVFA